MVHPGGKLKVGRRLSFGDLGTCEIVDVIGGGLRKVRFDADVALIMERFGAVPLPPYITRDADETDRDRYQTVYADAGGSVAAPTAGLHFTNSVLDTIRERGVRVEHVTLHVGPGTFKPVTVTDISQHRMHAEYYEVPPETAIALEETRAAGGRIWAVGTTSARVLESCTADGRILAGGGLTDIFIYPPYRFKSVDALITNFHLPGSTLIMLVAALAGLDQTMAAYRAAVDERYRFFSYGDAMVIH
jgi:S-adenosylmethionine:tRNA ribosyltransferase-isomerase